jgi:hypothetical protein
MTIEQLTEYVENNFHLFGELVVETKFDSDNDYVIIFLDKDMYTDEDGKLIDITTRIITCYVMGDYTIQFIDHGYHPTTWANKRQVQAIVDLIGTPIEL